MLIGLVSDTHLSAETLPVVVERHFREVDRILHAGDLVTLNVLRQFERIAPVTAVQGNMDLPGVRVDVPVKRVVDVEGWRIGLIHGHHVPHAGRVLSDPIDFETMHSYLVSEFGEGEVDCVVYGHTHQPCIETCRGVYIINPGSATRGRYGHNTLALLEVDTGGMNAELVSI